MAQTFTEEQEKAMMKWKRVKEKQYLGLVNETAAKLRKAEKERDEARNECDKVRADLASTHALLIEGVKKNKELKDQNRLLGIVHKGQHHPPRAAGGAGVAKQEDDDARQLEAQAQARNHRAQARRGRYAQAAERAGGMAAEKAAMFAHLNAQQKAFDNNRKAGGRRKKRKTRKKGKKRKTKRRRK